jgi:SAM-dependent methyltransferase
MSASPPKTALEYVSCPLCREAQHEPLYENRRIGGGLGKLPIVVVQCFNCGFLFNSPRPSNAALATYYKTDTMSSGQVFREEAPFGHYPKLHAQRASYFARLLAHRPIGRLLDVGCGNGGFIRAIAAELPGWDLTGLEPSSNAVDNCRAQGLKVQRGALGDNTLGAELFDAISLVSVLEHLADPFASLTWCRNRLKKGGLIFLEVPNSLQPELSLTGFFSLEHLAHFTPGSITRLLQHQGFYQVVLDKKAAGVIRLAAGEDFTVWKIKADPQAEEDHVLARQAVLEYAYQERRLIDSLRLRVTETLASWRKRRLKIAVYGAGIHSEHLANLVNLRDVVSCFLDGDPNKYGGLFLGLPVLAPSQLASQKIDAVLISSNRFIDEMTHTVRKLGGPEVEIRTCYE